MLIRVITAIICSLQFCSISIAADYSYESVAQRYSDSKLDADTVKEAKMHGECLVGLKQLNFQKRHDFDPVAEWTNYRSLSLLEQFPPCTVLIMIEVARAEMMKEDEKP